MAYKDIYDIPSQFEALELMLQEDEISEEEKNKLVEDLLEISSNDIDSARNFVLHLKNKLDVIKVETDKLSKLKKSTEKALENVEGILKVIITANGGKKINTLHGVVSTRKSKLVEILDETLLAEEFKTVEQVTKISKTKIKEAIDNGKDVAGATIKENMSIVVK